MVDDIGPDLRRMLGLFDIEGWDRAANEYFERTPQPNELFNHLGGRWLQQVVAPTLRQDLFQHTVGLVESWEQLNPPESRHKGTPYYFLGMGHTLLGDLDLGFLYMHLAFLEDQNTSRRKAPKQPAMRFVTLDASSDEQAFKDEVVRYAAFFEARLARYRTSTGSRLSLRGFRSRVIRRQALWDDMFHLVFSAARIRRLSMAGHVARSTPFGINLLTQALGDVVLVAEQWLRAGWPPKATATTSAGTGRRETFYPLAVRYLNATGYAGQGDRFMKAIKNAADAVGGWEPTLGRLLDGTFMVGGTTLDRRACDVGVAYLVRNEAAHRVRANSILGTRFDDIEGSLFAAVFGIVERLP